MSFIFKKKEKKPVVTPTPKPIKPQTVEEFHAQEMNKWGGGVYMNVNEG
jgi:hypothetical protein